MNLRIPGPTPLPPAVRQAMVEAIPGHRSKAFEQLLADVTRQLKPIFGTEGDVLVLTGSGTGGLEAAAANVLSPGDTVLSVTIGSFGERFAEDAEAFGAAVTRLDFPRGQAADPDAVAAKLQATPGATALLLTHCETSTGVVNDLAGIIAAARRVQPSLTVVVDAVSSLAGMPMRADEWGCDVVVTASQKALMAPAGLALVAVTPRGWEAVERAKMPRYYWDFRRARKFAARSQTPYTPAINALQGLQAGLSLIMAEGLEAVYARHARLAKQVRDGLRELGFRLVADERVASPTITAAWVPEGLSANALVSLLEDRYQVYLTGGHAKDKTIRIAHMGWVSEDDINRALAAIAVATRELQGGGA
ncbi:MAG: pyridoxal-phosphate-dependent aminotransferase family protein [Chloroflexota bacterium]